MEELSSETGSSIRSFPFPLERGEKVGTAIGTKELVVLDHSRNAHAGGWQRISHANDAGSEAHPHRISQRDVRRESQRDLDFRSCGYGSVQIEKDPACADILCLCQELVRAFADGRWQAHVKAPHHPPFLCVWLHIRLEKEFRVMLNDDSQHPSNPGTESASALNVEDYQQFATPKWLPELTRLLHSDSLPACPPCARERCRAAPKPQRFMWGQPPRSSSGSCGDSRPRLSGRSGSIAPQ